MNEDPRFTREKFNPPLGDDEPRDEGAPPHGEAEAEGQPQPKAPVRTPYPVDALGPILGAAARSIAVKFQVPAEIAAQSVLSVASLAAQGLVDVQLPMGQPRPVGLFFVTMAESSDRKTTSDREAMAPVRMYEKQLKDQYKILKEIYDVNYAAWQAQHVQIKHTKMELPDRIAKLKALGPAPEPPLQPIKTIDEGTVEGLIKAMPGMVGSLGIYSNEGAQLLHGHAFSDDAKRRSAATLSNFWDAEAVRRVRASAADVIIIRDRRLSLHVMIQPAGARDFLSDPVLRDQGLLSRILLAAPETMAGNRAWKAQDGKLDAALRTYAARLLSVFEVVPEAGDKPNELTPRALPLSPEALDVWVPFYDAVERDMGPGRRFAEMRDVAGKAGEQACRIAAILTIVDDGANADVIRPDAMSRACKLMHWYLNEALRLAEEYRVPQEVSDAQDILEWTRARGLRQVDAATLQKSGPGALRSKERFDPAIEVLLATGDFTPDPDAKGKARVWIVK
jgi:hypothetical protein